MVRKILPILLILRKVSILFIVVFETYLSIDEMMIKFTNWSLQTHRINNKPMKEGYKWFVMTDSITSYIVNFIPDGNMVEKDKIVTDKMDYKGGGKIIAMVKFLVQSLVNNMKESSELFVCVI